MQPGFQQSFKPDLSAPDGARTEHPAHDCPRTAGTHQQDFLVPSWLRLQLKSLDTGVDFQMPQRSDAQGDHVGPRTDRKQPASCCRLRSRLSQSCRKRHPEVAPELGPKSCKNPRALLLFSRVSETRASAIKTLRPLVHWQRMAVSNSLYHKQLGLNK